MSLVKGLEIKIGKLKSVWKGLLPISRSIYKLPFHLHESSLCWFGACAPQHCFSVQFHILCTMNIMPRSSQSFTAM